MLRYNPLRDYPVYAYCVDDEIFDAWHTRWWWTAWLGMWAQIALVRELGEQQTSLQYAKAFYEGTMK